MSEADLRWAQDQLAPFHRDALGSALGGAIGGTGPALTDLLQAAAQTAAAPVPPLRTVHHLACTGGTLICRCIAAMPNVRILSEVDPLSTINKHPFGPTDLMGLMEHGSRPPPLATRLEVFHAGLRQLWEAGRQSGTDLVLRDHSHSQFHLGNAVEQRPTLREILTPDYPVLSLVTLRHPRDSYLSVVKNNFVQFEPRTLEEYASRYHAFLDRHAGVPQLRYESFVADPIASMRWIAEVLDLTFNPDFQDHFPAIRLSGDSGRAGAKIAPRPVRDIPENLQRSLSQSKSYLSLCDRLSYPR